MGNMLLQVYSDVLWMIQTQADMITFFLSPWFQLSRPFFRCIKKTNRLIHEILNASDKRDISSWAGMSGSVYVTQLTTMRAVSLNDRRKSCAFMSFLDKLGKVGGWKMFPDSSTWEQLATCSMCPRNKRELPKKKKPTHAMALKCGLYPAFHLGGSLQVSLDGTRGFKILEGNNKNVHPKCKCGSYATPVFDKKRWGGSGGCRHSSSNIPAFPSSADKGPCLESKQELKYLL